MPSRRTIGALIRAFRQLGVESVTPSMLFERGDELMATTGQLLKRLHADDLRRLDQLLAEPMTAEWLTRLAETGLASETTTVHLLQAAAKRLDSEPAAASIIYSAAAQMAASLRSTPIELAVSLQGYALKGKANALRLLGEFDQAFSNLTEAARLFGTAVVCTPEAGQVEYTRAVTLFKREQWEEALEALAIARTHFLASHDERRAAHADLLEAGVLFDRGDLDAAREIWLRLRVTLANLNDRDALARVWMNLGACETRRGNKDSAGHWLGRARGAFRALGNQAELARTLWNIGTYLAAFRSRSRAHRALLRAQKAFEALGMWVDAGCVGLDLTALMIEDRVADEVLTRYAQEVAGIFVRAGLPVSAAHALDQLRTIARAADRAKVLETVRATLRDVQAPCDDVMDFTDQEAGASAPAS